MLEIHASRLEYPLNSFSSVALSTHGVFTKFQPYKICFITYFALYSNSISSWCHLLYSLIDFRTDWFCWCRPILNNFHSHLWIPMLLQTWHRQELSLLWFSICRTSLLLHCLFSLSQSTNESSLWPPLEVLWDLIERCSSTKVLHSNCRTSFEEGR